MWASAWYSVLSSAPPLAFRHASRLTTWRLALPLGLVLA